MHAIASSRDRTGLIIIISLLALLSITLLGSIVGGDTIDVPADHNTIQAAVDAARDGDIIRIAPGYYNESVIVDVGITIQGAGQGATVIHNTDSTILQLTANGTKVSNLTINRTNFHGILLKNVSSCQISNVTFTNCSRGITLDNADGCAVSDCSFFDGSKGVWVLPDSDENVFRSCLFKDCLTGWYVTTEEEDSDNNTLVDCLFQKNTHQAVRIQRSGLNTRFINCTIEDNTVGIDLVGGRYTTFVNCTISKNEEGGVYIKDTERLLVRNCTFWSNNLYGLNVNGSSNVVVEGSTFVNNHMGIFLNSGTNNVTLRGVIATDNTFGWAFDECWDITIVDCVTDDNDATGGVILSWSHHIEVQNSSFNSNYNDGLVVSDSHNVTVEDCEFLRDREQGMQVMGSEDIWIRNCSFYSYESAGLSIWGDRILVEDVTCSDSVRGISVDASEGVRIASVDLSGNRIGLAVYSSREVQISDANITDCQEVGVFSSYSSNVSISSTSVTVSVVGLETWKTDNITITECTIDNGINEGILMHYAQDVVILDTTMSNSKFTTGLNIQSEVERVQITRCRFVSNGWGAYIIDYPYGPGSSVNFVDCVFENNSIDGLMLKNIDNVNISLCNFTGQSGTGLYCMDVSNASVTENVMSGNGIGVTLEACGATEVWGNTIDSNSVEGVNITGDGGSTGVHLHNNNITGNGHRLAWGGVHLHEYGSGNVVEYNIIDGNAVGINISWRLPSGKNNIIRRNIITNSTLCGLIEVGSVKTNLIHLNMFVGNTAHVLSPDDNEMFDDGELGNLWDDYRERYPNAKRTGMTWDTPYEVEPGSGVLDYYPLAFWSDAGPPSADAGPDLVVGYGEEFILDGRGSWDDNVIETFLWSIELDDGPSLTFTGERPTPRLYQLGDFMVTLTVTDAWGNTDTDTMTVIVVDDEHPHADAGDDLTVDMGESFELNASRSWDNVGITFHNWSIEVDGQSLVRTIRMWTMSIQQPGVYTAVLIVTDGAGSTDVDTVNITVMDTETPNAIAGDGRRVDQGTLVTFDGTASTDNVAVASHTWYLRVGTEEVEWNGPTFSYTFLHPGQYEARLVVFDEAGNWADDTVEVRVLDTEDPVADAGNDLVVDQGEDFTLDGNGSTDNVGIVAWEWSYDLGDGWVTVADPRVVVSIPDMGQYAFLLKVVDEEGNWAEDGVSVRIRDSTPPVADAGENVTVEEGTTVTLSATGSRDNRGLAGYRWTFEYGGKTVELEGAKVEFEFGRPGTYQVTLTVVDGEGYTGMDTMTVEVTPVDVSGGPTSYLLVLVVVVVAVLLVLWRMRRRDD